MKNFCILLPAPLPAGPIKGAYALANSLAKSSNLDVFIIFLKRGPGVNSFLDKRVKLINLATHKKKLINKLFAYRNFLKNLGDKTNTTSLSMCFSADLINSFCGNKAYTISSIRGNLIKNYTLDYGYIGYFIALIHYQLLRFMNSNISMTRSMQTQIKKLSQKSSIIIPNFVDEDNLEIYRSKNNKNSQINLCFLGTLSVRKQPLLLLKSLKDIELKNFKLNIIGEGPLKHLLIKFIYENKLNEKVIVHGHLKNPYKIISDSDLFILPSLSEGISRACLESLYLGVPCILRDVDDNSQLVNEKLRTGLSFKKDNELQKTIINAIESDIIMKRNKSLLPKQYSQGECVRNYINVIMKNSRES